MVIHTYSHCKNKKFLLSSFEIYKKITSTLYTHLDQLIQAKNIYICTAKSTTFEFKWHKNLENFLNLKPHISLFLNHKMSNARNE